MTISVRASDVLAQSPVNVLGGRASYRFGDRGETVLNSAPQAREVRTLTVSAAVDSTVYAWSLAGAAQTYTSGVGATVTTIAAGILAVIDADPITRGFVSGTSSAGVITLTALRAGLSFALTETDASLSTALVSAAATAEAIGFGRLVISTGNQDGNALGGLAKSSLMSAQTDVYTTTYVALTHYLWSVSINGESYRGSVLAATNTATTLAAIATDVNAIVPASTVLASSTATTLTLTSEVAGLGFESGLNPDNAGASVPAVSKTGGRLAANDITLGARGVSLFRADIAPLLVDGVAVYKGNEGVEVLAKGEVWVESTESPSEGSPVHVELSGADAGRFFVAPSATRVVFPKAKFVRSIPGLALIDIAI